MTPPVEGDLVWITKPSVQAGTVERDNDVCLPVAGCAGQNDRVLLEWPSIHLGLDEGVLGPRVLRPHAPEWGTEVVESR